MTRMIRRAAYVLALVMVPLLGACATAGNQPGEDQVLVEVNNDLIPSSALTVFVLPEIGARRLIGNVDPAQTTTLTFDEFTGGQYRLMARTTAGNEIVSNPITIGNAAVLEWDLSANILTVKESRS